MRENDRNLTENQMKWGWTPVNTGSLLEKIRGKGGECGGKSNFMKA